MQWLVKSKTGRTAAMRGSHGTRVCIPRTTGAPLCSRLNANPRISWHAKCQTPKDWGLISPNQAVGEC